MSFRHLLVHIDSSERAADRIDLAVRLARRFNAGLTGLFAENDPHVMSVAVLDPAASLGPEAAKARADFAAAVSREQPPVDSDWRTVMTASDKALLKQAIAVVQNADLAIFGQHQAGRSDVRYPAELVEQAVLHSGRPILIVPFAGHFPDAGHRVMIAWNGSREAARALNDAMPFLHSASYVGLLAINFEPDPPNGEAPFADVKHHLAAHGITPEIETVRVANDEAMELLLSRLTDESIDLLVMGAYGRYGFPFLHPGKSTRHVLDHMTVPVLMAH